ncbi:MAG: hypothetical protein WD552_03065 [Candidatus Paceibacterota bacterium]
MSKDKLNKAMDVLREISLSETDRVSMRTRLAEHIDINQTVVSPWAPFITSLKMMSRSSAVAFAAILFLVGGVSLAAEQALPGDPLYPIKLNVNESFLSLTALSPTSDAVYQSRLASRRIAELEVLAARGELSEIISTHLTTAISKHTALAREEIAKISASGDKGDAASLETELSSSLATHSDILSDLSNQNGQLSTVTANAATRLRQAAQGETVNSISSASSTEVYRVGLENQNSSEQLSSTQIKRLLERTADRLASARSQFIEEAPEMGSVRIKATVEDLLTTSAYTIDQALNLINEDEYKAADPLLREAFSYAHRAAILMSSRRALEASSGISIDLLLSSDLFSVSSSSTSTQVGGADVVPDTEATTPTKVEDTQPAGIITPNKGEGGEQPASTSSSTPAVHGTSTTNISASSTATSSASSTGKQSFTREQSINTETNRQIERVLQRVKETLKTHTPQGFLPARTSHEDES